MLGAVAVVGAVLTASIGCASQPDDAPIFASDEEALAAAEEALNRYLDASFAYRRGEVGRSTVLELVSADRAVQEVGDLDEFDASGLHYEGDVAIEAVRLNSLTTSAGGLPHVVIEYCLDVSAIRILDADGKDVTPRDREGQAPYQSSFIGDPAAPPQLLFEGTDPGDIPC